jgi:hypothetical protein
VSLTLTGPERTVFAGNVRLRDAFVLPAAAGAKVCFGCCYMLGLLGDGKLRRFVSKVLFIRRDSTCGFDCNDGLHT